MPLVDVPCEPYVGALPADAARYIAAGQTQIDHFQLKSRGTHIPGFVPSEFETCYRALRAVVDGHLAPGNRFCEWGSGFGIVAGLAAMLGLEAYGIEIHQDLVDQAERLAQHFGLPVDFVCGSLVPPGGEHWAAQTSDMAWLTATPDDAYDVLGLEPADFDIVFAYPWPGEEMAIDDLFAQFAATGALLVSYHGTQGVRVQRKIPAKKRR